MADPVLTQEELEAIYAAMKSDDLSQASVEEYVLTSGHSYITSAEKAWTEAAKRMSSGVTSIMTGAIGKRLSIDIVDAIALESSQDEGYDDLMNDSVNQSAIGEDSSVITTVRIGERKMLLGIDESLARRFVDRRTGAETVEDDDEQQPAPKGLTALEHRLLNDLIRDLVICAVNASPEKPDAFLDDEPPDEVWIQRHHSDNWMLVRLSVAAFPGAGVWIRGPASVFFPRPAGAKNILARRISSTKVVLAAELGHFTMSVSELWNLKPGTLIPMNVAVGDPFQIRIGGVVKMTGKPTVSRGNIAVEIADRLIRGEEQ